MNELWVLPEIAVDPAVVRMLDLWLHAFIAYGLTWVILREDFKIVFLPGRFDRRELQETMQMVLRWLPVLWVTGSILVLIDVKGDLSLVLGRPKVMTKLLVVLVLTVNGWCLHRYAFPRLMNAQANTTDASVWAAFLGAISTVSWLYGGYLGKAGVFTKPPYAWGLAEFALPYIGVLLTGALLAVLIGRYRVERVIVASGKPDGSIIDVEATSPGSTNFQRRHPTAEQVPYVLPKAVGSPSVSRMSTR